MLPGNLMDDFEKQQGTSSILCKALCIISKPLVNSNWSYSLETLNLGKNRRFFVPWPWNLTDDLEKEKDTSSMLFQALCIISKPSVNSKWSCNPETPNLGQNQRFFVPCELGIWWITLKNNRASLLCYFKLCTSFHNHWWIQTGVSQETPNLGKNWRFFFSRMTFKIDRWPWLTIGHLS